MWKRWEYGADADRPRGRPPAGASGMAGDGARRSSSRRGGNGHAAMESRSGLRDLRSASGLDRTAVFSDAVLAIAMTILVLDLKAPDVAGRHEYDAALLAALL